VGGGLLSISGGVISADSTAIKQLIQLGIPSAYLPSVIASNGNGGQQPQPKRKLTINSQTYHMRELGTDEYSFELDGLFTSLSNEDFSEFETYVPPKMPSLFNSVQNYYTPCTSTEGVAQCTVEFTGIGVSIDARAVFSSDTAKYLRTVRETYVTEDMSVIVEYPPIHRGVRRVSIRDNQRAIRYQVGATGKISHCELLDFEADWLSLPEDFSFYPVDSGSADVTKFHIFAGNEDYVFTYNASTGIPISVDFPNDSSVEFVSFDVRDNRPTFESTDLDISTSQFEACLAVYDLQKNAEAEFPPSLVLSPDSTLEEQIYIDLYTAGWDFSLAYPPRTGPAAVYSQSDFDFYVSEAALDLSDGFNSSVSVPVFTESWENWAYRVLAQIHAATETRRLAESSAVVSMRDKSARDLIVLKRNFPEKGLVGSGTYTVDTVKNTILTANGYTLGKALMMSYNANGQHQLSANSDPKLACYRYICFKGSVKFNTTSKGIVISSATNLYVLSNPSYNVTVFGVDQKRIGSYIYSSKQNNDAIEMRASLNVGYRMVGRKSYYWMMVFSEFFSVRSRAYFYFNVRIYDDRDGFTYPAEFYGNWNVDALTN
jgi:hypothetical protein